MSINALWQVFCIIWALISFWIGGFGLLVALTVTYSRNHPESELGGWRRIVINLLLIVSGIAALAWAFDPGRVVEQTTQALLTLALLVLTLVVLYMVQRVLLRGRVRETLVETWWPRIRMPARLTWATATLLSAEAESNATARAALVLFTSVQVLLITWELWLRWHFRAN